MTDWWVELDTHVSPHHHEHSDGSSRRHVLFVRVKAETGADAVKRLEQALQSLVNDVATPRQGTDITGEK